MPLGEKQVLQISTSIFPTQISLTFELTQHRADDSLPDLACTRCRERKIRCDRERPQCKNCEREKGSANDAEDVPEDSGEGGSPDDSSPASRDAIELHIFRNRVDMTDRYHGPSSLFSLCNHFRIRALECTPPKHPRLDMLHNLCEIAGVTESFPFSTDQPLTHLLPKQQVVTALNFFFQHLDCTIDIFVQSNLLSNLERVYSQPPTPDDDPWVVCFKAITLLVLGTEISRRSDNALFGDFTRSILPSRVGLVNSRLLSTPRLINVQTLIILSVAAERFDPPGWGESLFSYACLLAKTMGLQHANIPPQDASLGDQTESAKVLQSLFTRDKTLGTTRGSVSWLSKYDCFIANGTNQQALYSDRMQLSCIQDDIHRMIQDQSRRRSISSRKQQAALQVIEEQLNAFASASGIFNTPHAFSKRRATMALEFLSTRILAFQQGSEARHAEKMRSDARASCLLLLIADGDQDEKIHKTFRTLVCPTSQAYPRDKGDASIEVQAVPFTSIFDTFSVPAFFILLEGLLRPSNGESTVQDDADLELLIKVSASYKRCIGRIQANSYHGKVGWMFEKLLGMISHLQQAEHPSSISTPPPTTAAEKSFSNSTTRVPNSPQMLAMDTAFATSTAQMPGLITSMDFSNLMMTPKDGDMRDWFTSPPTLTTPLSWDGCFPATPLLGTDLPFDMLNAMDIAGSDTTDLLTQLLSTSDCLPDLSMPCMQWSTPTPQAPFMRKRQRTYDETIE
ncbi:hypothetical protein CC86DRAFT_347591 [Ophiobolus disseminans]|uniref:Zn(2)-C6 fungal-type domain-containing protein n=1 Tax=Ophiobolus disseminans TaxID=1469910 RepID=A0A6A7A4P8_9PLEO|nr:hypothetical protein CC86DRAFT_347591 [Ophiobolus disseminans]